MDCEVEFNAALVFGLFGIAADTLFGELCRKDAKFTELHALAMVRASVMPSRVSWITVKISCCVSVDFSDRGTG